MPETVCRCILNRMWVHRTVFAVAAYVLFALALGTVYFVVQHDGRNAVEDGPRALLSAADTSGQPHHLDLSGYQGVFWMRYDAGDRPTGGNGYLHGALAAVPRGVLDDARRNGEDAVTWQPAEGLRFAIVAQPQRGGDVVVAGQSLQRTELRASQTLIVIVLALIGGLVVAGAAIGVDAVVTAAAARASR